jgi:nucleoid-associated protein YgaU
MGIMSFFKDAGEKLFGHKDAETIAKQAQAAPDDAALQAASQAANQAASKAIETYIGTQDLSVQALSVAFDAHSGQATVSGQAQDQSTKEKVLLCCGNVHGVLQVNDNMSVDQATQASQFYTVESGDTLSAIAKEHYGNANEYMKIFEANKPMLKHPDKIYPGQMLRIPA